jgi:ABC-2 type transport system ATP-binding protein
MNEDALVIRGLRKAYKGFTLDGVSFSVPRGHIMGLIGPNGAGKTTIVKLIMNLVPRDEGEITVFGLDNRRDEAAIKARIGFVYDTPCFHADMTLATYRRAVAPFYATWDEAAFERLVSEFELPLTRRFKALSQGMQTTFALVIALSHGADLLILDEPTTGLDPVFRRELLQRLSAFLQDERRSILFSTHITTDLEKIADYVTFIRDGRIAFSLPKDRLLEDWGIVKGDDRAVAAIANGARQGVRRGAYGVEVLTSDVHEARRRLGPDVVIDRPSLDDIMVLMTEGRRAA